MFEPLRKALLAGVGAQEKVMELMEELVKKGELSESQGAKLVKEWSAQAEKSSSELNKTLSDVVTKAMQKMNLPKKDDIDKLSEAVLTLSEKVRKLEEKG